MKKKNKKNHIRMRFSTLLLCILAVLLCTAAYGAHNPDYTVGVGDVLNVGIGTDMDVERIEKDYLYVYGTVNLYPGAYVYGGIYAVDGSAVNIYAGELGADYSIMLMGGALSTAAVTVYGTGFAVDDELLDTSVTQFTVDSSGGVLTGSYENGAPIHLLFYSKVPIHLVNLNLDVEVEIDIKPGSDDNSINLKSKGVVPVAVFTIAGGLDAGTINPDTVLFAGASPERWKLCDVDGDGDDDRLFHFKTENLVELDVNSTVATLTGTTFGGNDIELTDTVRIVPTKK